MLNVIALKKTGVANIHNVIPNVYEVREYRTIDFVLPGMLGFSILFSTLFGISFTFFQFRQQLILKRFYATPVSRMNILLGIGISRLVFQLINVVMLIGLGYFFLHFTLVHGLDTFLEMTFLTGSLNGFARWFMLFGDNAEIVSPQSLKDNVKGVLSSISKKIK